MGLAPQIVEEVFEIVKDLNQREKRDLPAGRAEHQHGAALRRLRLHPGERPRRDGRRGQGPARERGRQGVLPRHGRRRPQELPRRRRATSGASAGCLSPRRGARHPRRARRRRRGCTPARPGQAARPAAPLPATGGRSRLHRRASLRRAPTARLTLAPPPFSPTRRCSGCALTCANWAWPSAAARRAPRQRDREGGASTAAAIAPRWPAAARDAEWRPTTLTTGADVRDCVADLSSGSRAGDATTAPRRRLRRDARMLRREPTAHAR
ncbi:MAG: hypothetical protein MZW92_65055 [Comamonadaceae bacterium]|nr:hypothetical protein [Comamonadaceae bacterium]